MKGILTPKRYAALCGVSLALTVLVVGFCFLVNGSASGVTIGIPSSEVWPFRAGRVLAAALVGAGLAGAGTLLQAMLRNALADPYLLGISSGASVGVVIWLLVGMGLALSPGLHVPHWFLNYLFSSLVIPALFGALIACVVVFALTRMRGGGALEPITLLLVGVVINAINGAFILLISSIAPPAMQLNITRYLMGSVSEDTTMAGLLIAAVALLVGWLPAILQAGAMNIATLSEVEAASLGVALPRLRRIMFFCACVLTGLSVALAGPIGFIGLICPHICRRLFGPDQRQMMITAPCCGAIFLMLADTFVRSTVFVFHGELPVGVITALCGGPFFLLLLKRRQTGEPA